MNHSKYLSITGALLVLFICASTTPSIYALDTPEEQRFAVGGQIMFDSDGAFYGVNARLWTESQIGFEFGWGRHSESESVAGVKVDAKWDVIPVSALYSIMHYDAGSVYIRPYVGGGINIGRISASASGYGESYSDSETKIGGQGFGGVEFTFTSAPRLSIGFDAGYYKVNESKGGLGRLMVNYYLK